MKVRGGEFSTGTMGNFQPELTVSGRDTFRAIIQRIRIVPLENLEISERMRVIFLS